MPVTLKSPVSSGVNIFDPAASAYGVFDTKEEFIAHLIKTKEIKKESHRYNDGMIHLAGTLKIDHRVKKGLNWSDVVATAAIVDKGMVSRYQYLPRTSKGIKTTLDIPSLDLYMLHNNFDAICTNGHYVVNLFRIPEQAGHLDFSSVRTKLALFYGQKIALSKLPQADNILGLNPSHLVVDCPNPYRIAKTKGCGTEVLNMLRPKNPLFACIYRLIGQKK